MKNAIINTLIFLAGAGVGSVVTYKVIKEKFVADEDARVEEFKKQWAERREKEVCASANYNKGDLAEMEAKIIKATEDYRMPEAVEMEDVQEEVDSPRVISPNEVGVEEDYDIISLTYYDQVNILMDSDENVISEEEQRELLGSTAVLGTFGDYEEDSVYVVNDERKAYYEILRYDKEED